MVGVSYGGGIQLVTAVIDDRVDAIVQTIAVPAPWDTEQVTGWRGESLRECA